MQKLAAGDGLAPSRPPSKGGVLLIRRPGKKMVEPEVVATSPYPGKSRVPVCCGFDSLRLVLAAGFAPALATFSTSCLCIGLREQMEWSLQPVLLRQKSAGCCMEAKMVAVPGAAPDTAGL